MYYCRNKYDNEMSECEDEQTCDGTMFGVRANLTISIIEENL